MRRLTTTLPILILAWVVLAAPCQAGIFNRLGRMLGLGWSDGYNARPHRTRHGHWHPAPRGYHNAYQIAPSVSPHIVPVSPPRVVPNQRVPAQPLPTPARPMSGRMPTGPHFPFPPPNSR